MVAVHLVCKRVRVCFVLVVWFAALVVAQSGDALSVFVDSGARNAETCFVFDPNLGNYTLSCGVLDVCPCKSIVGAVETSELLLNLGVIDPLSISVCANETACVIQQLPWNNFTAAEVLMAPGTYEGQCNTDVGVSQVPVSFSYACFHPPQSIWHVLTRSRGQGLDVVVVGEAAEEYAFRFDGVGPVIVSNLTLRAFSSPILIDVVDAILSVSEVVVDSVPASSEASVVALDATSSLTARNLYLDSSAVDSIFVTNQGGGALDVVGLYVTDCRIGVIGQVTVRDAFTMSNVTLARVSTLYDASDRRILEVTLQQGVAAVSMDNWLLRDLVLLASSVVFVETADQPVVPTASFSDWTVEDLHGPRSTLVEIHGVASIWRRLTVAASHFETIFVVADGSCDIDSGIVSTTHCDKGIAGAGHAALSLHDVVFIDCRTQYGFIFASDSDASSRVEVSNSFFDSAGPAILTHDGSTIVRDSTFVNVNDVAVSLSSANPEQPALLLGCTFVVTGTAIGSVYSDGFAVIENCTFTSGTSPTAIVFGRQLPDGDDDFRSVTVTNCTFEGACIIASVSRLFVISCRFDNPVSTTFVNAGAAHPVNSIFATGDMTRFVLSDTTVQNANSEYDAQDSSAGVTPSAVEVDGKLSIDLDVDIINCTFANNFAYRGGALQAKNANVSIRETAFIRNSGGSGGAIAVEGGVTVLGDVVFRDNEALEDGGALWAGIHSSIDAAFVAFVGNSAHSSGGGVYFGATSSGILDRVLFTNCTALFGGGFVATGKSSPVISNSLFSHCTCSSSGGAVSVADYSTAKFFNCTVRDNVANSYGAGFHISAFSSPVIANCTVETNMSPNSGGGIYVQDEATPTISDTTVAGNVAESVGGGMMFAVNSSGTVSNCVIVNNTGRSKGGGLALEDFSHPLIQNTLLTSNRATSAAGFLAMDSASPIFSNCTFEDNTALSTGGAGLSSDFTNVFFTSCSFLRNTAKFSSGGALALSGFSNATLLDSNFHANFAHGGGGALFHSSLSPPTVSNCTFVENSVAENGGGALLLVSASRVYISESEFVGNVCGQGGGGALFSAASNGLEVLNTTFSVNTAIGHGGAMYLGGSCIVDVQFCKFELNNSTASGGGLYLEHGALGTISDTAIISNIAVGGKGGGAFMAATGLLVSRVVFSSNTATFGGALLQQPPLLGSDEVTRYVECNFDNNVSLTNGGAVSIEFAAGVGNQTEVPPTAVPSLGRLVCAEGSCYDYRHGRADSYVPRPQLAADGYAFTSCQFRFNNAAQNGGAVSMDLLTGSSNFYEPLFLGNSAGHFGGAIFAQVGSAAPMVTLGTFSNNVATWAGRNMGFRIVEDAAAVDQSVCFECLLGKGVGETGYDNPKGFATMPSVIAYAENTTCPSSLTLGSAEFSLSLGLRDDFTTKVEGPLLEETSFIIAYNFTGANCTVNAPYDSGFRPLSGETGVVTFANLTVSGRSNSTCEMLFSSLPVRGLRLPFEHAIQEECLIALGGCPAGEEVVQGDDVDSCQDEAAASSGLVHIMVAVIFGLLLIVLMLFLCNVALQYQEHKKRAKKAYYAALEIDDEFLVPGKVTLEDVLNDPEITRIPFKDVTVGKRIGFGASGVVCSAIWHRDSGDCEVAMKELLFHLSDLDTTAIHEFLVEIKLMSALHHRNVVQFLGIVYHEDRLYLVTELMQYGCLRELLTKKGSNLSWRLKMKLLVDAAKGMRYLHSKNLIHRDLKPQNLLVNSCWKCKIADFGISTVMTRTRTLTAVGTPVYMAPEVLNNERYSQKADVYSFGIVVAEVFSGQRPYAEHSTLNDAQLLYKIYHENLRPNIEDLPHLLAELVRESVDENPVMRPSFGEIVERLKRLKTLELSSTWEPADQGWDSETSAPEQSEVAIIVPSDGDLATSLESESGFLLGATPERTSRSYARRDGPEQQLFSTNGSINNTFLE